MLLRNRDFWAGLIVLLLGALLLVFLIPSGIDEPKKVKFAVLSPSYYPRLISIALVLLGLAIAVGAATSKSAQQNASSWDATGATRLCFVLLVLAATAYVLPFAGFVLTTAIAIVVLMTLAGERNPAVILPAALLVPILLQLFFTKVANVPIPGGILEPYLQRI